MVLLYVLPPRLHLDIAVVHVTHHTFLGSFGAPGAAAASFNTPVATYLLPARLGVVPVWLKQGHLGHRVLRESRSRKCDPK